MLPRSVIFRVFVFLAISTLIFSPSASAEGSSTSQAATVAQGLGTPAESPSTINNSSNVNSAEAELNCAKLLSEPSRGANAVRKLGANIAFAAKINNKSETDFNSLFDDDSHWVDTCGRSFFVDPIPENASSTLPAAAALPGKASAAINALLLHSKLGSPRTLYLDFNPRTISNTAWNANYNAGATWSTPGFSMDTDYATFSSAELTLITSIWEQVAEDYAAFDIDVTTEQPAAGILERLDINDNIYGTRVLISDDSLIQSSCSCGGISYVGVSNISGASHEYYQPSWVFSQALSDNVKFISEAISHEAGHAFGLSHQGTTTTSYFAGANGWAPIMGVGYSQPLTQWSKGEYPGANNLEDEYSVMAKYGLAGAVDEDSNKSNTARISWVGNSLKGIISTPNDFDFVKFTPSASGTFTFTVFSGSTHQNLDVKLDLLTSDGNTVMQSADSTFVPLTSEKSSGLDANLTVDLVAGNTYFLKIDGTGYLSATTGGYSDYGSVGSYNLNISGPVAPLSISDTKLPSAILTTPYSYQLTALGGYPQYSWSASGLPAGLTITSAGLISGTPSSLGTFSIVLTVSDSKLNLFSQTLAITVYDKLSLQSNSIPQAVIGRNYSSQLTAIGGIAPYQWTAITIPVGLQINNSGLLYGLLSTSGTFGVVVQISDASGQKIQSSLNLVVNPEMNILTTTLPDGSVGLVYNSQISFSGGLAPVTISSSNLPNGLFVSSAGAITGTPTIQGIYNVTFNLQDSAGIIKSFTLALTVTSAPVLISATLPGATLNSSYSYQFSASGGVTPYTYTSTSLPSGLLLSTSGLLSGKPTKSGTFTFTVTATDNLKRTAQASYTLVITAPLLITSSALPNGVRNLNYSITLTATGGTAPYKWSSSVLPNGLTFSTTGILSGAPADLGTFSITFTVIDSIGRIANKTLTYSVYDSLLISTTLLPNGSKGTAYSIQLLATGGNGVYNWTRTTGSLPSGVSLSSTGLISGMPTKSGIFKFTLKVVSGSQSSSINLVLTIN